MYSILLVIFQYSDTVFKDLELFALEKNHICCEEPLVNNDHLITTVTIFYIFSVF